MHHACFEILMDRTTDDTVVIHDLGPWDRHPTVTNDAEWVVQRLHRHFGLAGRRLYYIDSEGFCDEIVHDGAGQFVEFRPEGID